MWGYCEQCDRWFSCPMDRTADWACPSCGIEPIRIENRTLGAREGAVGATAGVGLLERTRRPHRHD